MNTKLDFKLEGFEHESKFLRPNEQFQHKINLFKLTQIKQFFLSSKFWHKIVIPVNRINDFNAKQSCNKMIN